MSTKKLLPFFALLVVFSTASTSFASSPVKPKNDYIDQYSPLAVAEMQRSNIPASITMAQAILESSWGNGTLARQANNHFGIKCNNRWQGDCFDHLDDDYDKEGNLIESSFRFYNNVEESYADHSNFLTGNARYEKLFSYDAQDYVSWALGLKAAGYATDSLYGVKLIETIEKYELYKLDGRQGPILGPEMPADTFEPIAMTVAPKKEVIQKTTPASKNPDELDEITPMSYQQKQNTSTPTTEPEKSGSWESIYNKIKNRALKTWNNIQPSVTPKTEEEILFERGLKEENDKPKPRIIFVEERQVR